MFSTGERSRRRARQAGLKGVKDALALNRLEVVAAAPIPRNSLDGASAVAAIGGRDAAAKPRGEDRRAACPADSSFWRGRRFVTSTSWSTMGTAGSISGSAYDSVELQSLGDGRFNVIGREGSLTVE